MKPYEALHVVRSVERLTVTKLNVTEGLGEDGVPIRTVAYWYDDEGQQLARFDPVEQYAVPDDIAGPYTNTATSEKP